MTVSKADGRMTVGRAGPVVVAALALGLACAWLALASAPAYAGKALSGTMVVNGGDQYTTASIVTVTLQVRGARTMRFQQGDGSFTSWETYATTKTWDLGAGDGPKTVTAQFRGTTGARVTMQATITLDSTGPTTVSDYDGVPRAVVTVALTAEDALSGVATTFYRVAGGAWREGTITTLRVFRKRGGFPAGTHTLEFFSTDMLGNVGPTGQDAIVLQ